VIPTITTYRKVGAFSYWVLWPGYRQVRYAISLTVMGFLLRRFRFFRELVLRAVHQIRACAQLWMMVPFSRPSFLTPIASERTMGPLSGLFRSKGERTDKEDSP